jgi:hypothetical protein
MKQDNQKLRMWQERLSHHDSAFEKEAALMDKREEIYRGDKTIRALVEDDKTTETTHVRNVASEIIEAQVNSNIPSPKVEAREEKYEWLAKIAEDMLRNELTRLPIETLNDMQERTVPIQGGGAFLIDWDNSRRTHTTVGELVLKLLHPKMLAPQEGVYEIEEMAFFMVKVPTTKQDIKRRFGIDLDEGESEPDIKSVDDQAPAKDMVDRYIGYFRNDNGGIGKYSWVGDTQLEDYEDYQARRLRKCVQCGGTEPLGYVQPTAPTKDGTWPGTASGDEAAAFELLAGKPAAEQKALEDKRPKPAGRGKKCVFCGGTEFEDSQEDEELLVEDIVRQDGSVIPAGTKVPFYKPNIYPVVIQNNVSIYGQLLGESDIDKIADQQNSLNRVSKKIIDKVFTSGSYISLPPNARIRKDSEEMKIIDLESPKDKEMIDVFTMEADISNDIVLRDAFYEEARQIVGITDSFQGRKDPTANSGKAKEFAAAQSAGRLESKRTMKKAAYAKLFEAIFKFMLAYADELRPIVSTDFRGQKTYGSFNRYDFLVQDAAGEWFWYDNFLFSCDETAPLASNREAMWQETRLNLQTGAFGDPTRLETLILFWQKMDLLHYPGAKDTKQYLEEQLQTMQQMAKLEERAAAAEALVKQQDALLRKMAGGQSGASQPAPGAAAPVPGNTPGAIPQARMAEIDAMAQRDAAKAAGVQLGAGRPQMM